MSTSSREPRQSQQEQEQLSIQSKIYAWTLSDASITPCFVRDALSMSESGVEGMDYFWLGRVPCRTVLLIGLLVGVTVHESRILYTLDDGTGVVDSVHRPEEAQKRGKNVLMMTPSLKPIAGVGTTVRITGKVKQWRDTRQIHINNIERCSSVNEEPQHWIKVANLHKSYYDIDEPFTVPSTSSSEGSHDPPGSKPPPVVTPDTTVPHPLPVTPKNQPIEHIDPTNISPSRSQSVPPSSCEEAIPQAQYTPKLRHPSRIPTAKLTENTFRIYLKYYMDNVCNLSLNAHNSKDIHTKSQSMHRAALKPKEQLDLDNDKMYMANLQGFTMSYLRRVPELALLAKRVVIAERKRRIREERRKERERGGPSNKPNPVESENYSRKMKRLFRWAIVKLHEDGSVVQWDGLKRAALSDPNFEVAERSRLWQSQSETSTTTLSLSSISLDGEIAEGELSDPDPDEEAHIPLTVEYLDIVVCTAIRAMDRGSLRHLHHDSKKPLSQRRGYTSKEVTKFLNRYDERWRNVGEWAVEEALKHAQSRDCIYDAGGGRWELCL